MLKMSKVERADLTIRENQSPRYSAGEFNSV